MGDRGQCGRNSPRQSRKGKTVNSAKIKQHAAIVVRLAHACDVITPACRICLGHDAHMAVRLAVGLVVMVAAIVGYQWGDSQPWPAPVVADLLGFIVHSVGLTPWIDGAAKLAGIAIESE